LCKNIIPADTGIKFLFLMHPKEAYRQKTGTGRLSALSLLDSEILIGIDFTHNPRLNELISGTGAGQNIFPVVLYPAKDVYFTDTPSFKEDIGTKKLMVIVVDATWFFAQRMVKLSTNLFHLPKLSFKNAYRSQYQFKRQPAPECLSTIESCYYLLEELKSVGIANKKTEVSGLMEIFHTMVNRQLMCEQTRRASDGEERKA